MMDTVGDQAPRDEMRASDRDREQVAERLRSAHAEGRLDLAEFDERVRQAWAARTYGELQPLTADLPATRPASRPAPPEQAWPQHRGQPQGPHHGPRRAPHRDHGHRAAVGAWLSVSLINLVIWAVVSVGSMHLVYPWWVWVAGPWGALLLARWISGLAARTDEA